MEIGDKAPEISIVDQEGKPFSLETHRGKWIVLYFYPKDNTPGCTVEAVDFTTLKSDFERMNAIVVGVSPDSVKAHQNFINKKELDLILLSDPEHSVIEQFGAWKLKKNYGREYFGVERSTVLIDPGGKIAYIWRKVKAKGHAEAVKNKLVELVS